MLSTNRSYQNVRTADIYLGRFALSPTGKPLDAPATGHNARIRAYPGPKAMSLVGIERTLQWRIWRLRYSLMHLCSACVQARPHRIEELLRGSSNTGPDFESRDTVPCLGCLATDLRSAVTVVVYERLFCGFRDRAGPSPVKSFQ